MISIFDQLESFTTDQLDAAIAQLPPQRREQALKFKHEQGRKENVLAYRLLCKALGDEYGMMEQPVFEYNEHGKPFIASHPEIHFNLSHCKRAVACIVSSKGRVGIDVECTDRYREGVARYVLSDEEFERVVKSADRDVEFAKYWTQKEALVKMLGTGITDDLKSILSTHSDVQMHTMVCREKGYVYSWCEK